MPLYTRLKKVDADVVLVSLENLHFTLQFLGEVEEGKMAEVQAALWKVASFYPSFTRKFRWVQSPALQSEIFCSKNPP